MKPSRILKALARSREHDRRCLEQVQALEAIRKQIEEQSHDQ